MDESQNSLIAPYDGSIQQVSKTTGKFVDLFRDHLEPWRLDRLGKAQAKRIKRLTSAKADRILRIGEAENARDKKDALARIKIREWEWKQGNREAAVQEAKKYLPRTLPREKPEADWINDYFNNVENISNEGLRTVFSKILAGEVEKPGTFSRTAISIAREMRATDIKLLQKARSLIWFLDIKGPGGGFIPEFINDNRFPAILNSDDMLHLGDMRLLRVSPGLRVLPPAWSVLRYGSHHLRVGDKQNLGIPASTTTRAADELFRVFDFQENQAYIDASFAFFRHPSVAIDFSPAL